MDKVQIIGIIAGVFTASSLIPQLIKTLKEKKSEDVSIGMLVVLLAGLSLWLVYGLMRDDAPIIYTNAFSLLLNISMIFLRFKYNR